ncbi:cytosolic 5'-nucleotidase 3-like [Gadus macrocephalus]|uniref:cytosolic 5'-nucleotidase 3-like n=1 Tax=Gadus macrocephalus TaxID=80720 RepID=UPI0028CB9DF6|nr:cytosolic 5'-nucleotidase 3-like [Gadus macrocephalus]
MTYPVPWINIPVRTALAIWYQWTTRTELPELSKVSVLMRQRNKVENTLRAMQHAGPGTLQVISDFDMTLSRFAHHGKRVPTTHNILDHRLLIDEDCACNMRKLLKIYYPIEIDPSLTSEQKIPLMVEWWTKVHHLLIQQKIQRDMLAQAVQESGVILREGYEVFFDRLAELQVPLLIFSAGVGDILEEVVRQSQVFHPNVHVISNCMDFDANGVLRGFKGPLIHTFNKREGALLLAAPLPELRERPNVLLLGDSLGDLAMADGVARPHNLLTVGFLNDQVEERTESYVEAFDIVLVKDETMEVPNAVLKFITSGKDAK